MAIGTQDNSDEVMSEINMIPFIDVMLVLLIIFIITVPVIQHAVNVELPQASHPWYVGVQFHPEFKSTPWDGHPLFTSYVKAALDHQLEGVANKNTSAANAPHAAKTGAPA